MLLPDKFLASALICLAPSLVHGQCFPPATPFDQYTDDFFLTAAPSFGDAAPGEVIGVELSLTIKNFHQEYDCDGLGLVAAYDPELGDVLGEPVYSENLEEFAGPAFFYRLRERDGLKGFVIGFPIRSFADPAPFIDTPVKICTVYFRIHGEPGDSFEVSFPDDKLADFFNQCVRTQMTFTDKVTREMRLIAHSKIHVPGIVNIVDREPIRTEPPPEHVL